MRPCRRRHRYIRTRHCAASGAVEPRKAVDRRVIFENQNVWNKLETNQAVSVFSQYATELNLDQEKFDSCLLSAKYVDEIRNDLDDGREYGVSGTPGFFIGNDQVGFVELKGAQLFENFKKVLDAQLG